MFTRHNISKLTSVEKQTLSFYRIVYDMIVALILFAYISSVIPKVIHATMYQITIISNTIIIYYTYLTGFPLTIFTTLNSNLLKWQFCHECKCRLTEFEKGFCVEYVYGSYSQCLCYYMYKCPCRERERIS